MKEILKTLPASWYHDPLHYEVERKAIFGTEWLYAADQQELKKAGDYLTFEIAGFPLVLVVGSDQKIHGFHNVCRHRAATLLNEKKGNLIGSSITCKYHGWTFDLAGSLVQAPYFDTREFKKQCDVSLFEVQVGLMNGMVFINLDRNAPPFERAYFPVRDEIQQENYLMEEYTARAEMRKEGEFNWKIWMDGFQECYHCMTIHPILMKDFSLKDYQIANLDGFSRHSCRRKNESKMGGFEGLWLWVYPNLGLPCYEPCFYTLQVNPLGPTRTELNYRFRFKDTVSETDRLAFIALIEKITMEDFQICEQVQKNLKAGVFQEGYLNPERENGVEYFHRLVRKAVQVYETAEVQTHA